ncbi:hypothetical protein [Amycolatopsis jejuensis]|uniref:hypothetical protein n=1 Tax=Amycolatopsis jejuensis TaxID=330084 RepID=UPI001FE09041|nr:hypothetical protein [Amycolatopsis jejuensis]
MTNTSMDDAGRCLLSVAWNIRTGGPRADPRSDAVRERLQTVCRRLGHATCRYAAVHPGGDPVPLLRLADRAYEIDTLLLLVGTSLIPDPARDARRWGEIDGLVSELDTLTSAAGAAVEPVCGGLPGVPAR